MGSGRAPFDASATFLRRKLLADKRGHGMGMTEDAPTIPFASDAHPSKFLRSPVTHASLFRGYTSALPKDHYIVGRTL